MFVAVLACGAGLSWWVFLTADRSVEATASRSLAARPILSASLQDSVPSPENPAKKAEPGSNEESKPPSNPNPPPSTESRPQQEVPSVPAPVSNASRITSLVVSAEEALSRNELIAARMRYQEAYDLQPQEPIRSRVRGELIRLGGETVLSPRIFENDSLTATYVLQPGDSLAKVAAQFKVTPDLLAALNGIADKNLVRAGQTIKVIQGPFSAMADKRAFLLEVYLDKTLVTEFKVGLGADGSTPTGKWQVSGKLVNPTYYPPRGGQIIAADDAKNPLGERWIGLVGIEGNAIGQERYGIHGTIEPGSIGKSTSMGCIRLKNEDVERLYMYLVEKHSTVTVK
ncbi:MAG: L,D-transpeptidase family protein [Planctomycetota bacterium]